MAQDKFFETVRDRFEVHRARMARDLEYLEHLHYDHLKELSPDFKVQIEAAQAALKRMEELIDELGK